jgi:hypothetical protein
MEKQCLKCSRSISWKNQGLDFCSDKCYVGYIKNGRGNDYEARTRARYREGKAWLEKVGFLAMLRGEVKMVSVS